MIARTGSWKRTVGEKMDMYDYCPLTILLSRVGITHLILNFAPI